MATYANYLAFGINYTSKNYTYRQTRIPIHQITLEANIFLCDHLAITSQSKQIIYGGSTLVTFHHQLQAGLK